MANINCTLDNFKFPALPLYENEFGTKKDKGGLTTVECCDVTAMPFSRQRPFIINEDSETTKIDCNTVIKFNASNITLTIGNGSFDGCQLCLINTNNGTVQIKASNNSNGINGSSDVIELPATSVTNLTYIEGWVITNISHNKGISKQLKAPAADNDIARKVEVDTVDSELNEHIDNKENPHEVTKEQVGLGNIENLAISDQTPEFTESSALENIDTKESLGTIFGKIKKWISNFITFKTQYSDDLTTINTTLGNKADKTGTVAYATKLGDSDNAYTYSSLKTALGNKVNIVSGKGLSTNDFTTDEKNKLAGIATGAQVNSITGVKGDSETTYRTGNVNITKANIGLGNVDNTSDLNKVVNAARRLYYFNGDLDKTLFSSVSLTNGTICSYKGQASDNIKITNNSGVRQLVMVSQPDDRRAAIFVLANGNSYTYIYNNYRDPYDNDPDVEIIAIPLY